MQMLGWLKTRFAQLKYDVWDDPTIRPGAAILLSGLALLVTWLTVNYAPEAHIRSEQRPVDWDSGTIDPAWGFVTIGVVSIVTLAAGFEPILIRAGDRWWRTRGRRDYLSLSSPLRWSLRVSAWLCTAPAKVASVAWSFADFLLARPVAILAGARWRGWKRRYLHFATLIAMAGVYALLEPTNGLYSVVAGLIAILGIVRRWSWIESDRDTFLVERGERETGKAALRVGFSEDLRDEALFALICLFILVPLGLDLVYQSTCAQQACAFAFDHDALPEGQFERFLTWTGYFGVELAKTIPFVDWSEVFHVANGSPITPESALGSQITFTIRAGLDLLFLAALLQAVQIATRLREQQSAFRAGRLPILEPFAELLEMKRAGAGLVRAFGGRPTQQPSITNFPNYDEGRLTELVRGDAEIRDVEVRKVAAALLQHQHRSPRTNELFTKCGRTESDPLFRDWLLEVASDLTLLANAEDPALRASLVQAIRPPNDASPEERLAAVRLLGRSALQPHEATSLIDRLSDASEAVELRAAAAVPLAKGNWSHSYDAIHALAGEFSSLDSTSSATIAMTLAFALAHFANEEEVITAFPSALSRHIERAVRLQRTPVLTESDLSEHRLNQTVLIAPGTSGFPKDFEMGASNDDEEAASDEKPRRRVTMSRQFCIGRLPVTQQEYLAFTDATGRKSLDHSANVRWPAIFVSWYDALEYCDWLSIITGDLYRLPTEAEWEYVCRAGEAQRYAWGDDWDSSKANSNASPERALRNAGAYAPNRWGVCDMHGNVYEWCADPWHDGYPGAPTDERAWLADADFASRVRRGGSWVSGPQNLRSSFRGRVNPWFKGDGTGFRILREVAQVPAPQR